ncbi:biosynthetic peptidoglycan transglycosylase [Mesorhizobium sp. VK24D]|uniref:Biosynthetic peptidoglycan transglycosylase n=1 Tax=Mesorhizobium album TaxID=3072314 RepID=A0ABU4Y154_9HYPH|nr:biosynthetic peptidoglycan transglycosylase [Mesorhizobium sp. VK24D]MDX8480676.1 biosynthetic peptidoglycan transglycosylase [Mesorhizobium sp. VK24D]
MLGVVPATAYLVRTTPDLDCLLATPVGSKTSAPQGIHLSELPPYVVDALISAEDRNFYGNFGAEPLSMLRALYADIRAGRIVQGGSTISEQLAKNLLPPQQSRILQKIREIVVVMMLEHRFSKNRILELYLDRVYFGSGAYGIEAAARRYFGKSASKLTLYEAAMLVGALPAPSYLNPLHDPARAERRAQTVLQDMVEAGHLTPEERRRALAGQGEAANQ